MNYKYIGSRGIVFSFPELEQTNLLAIYGDNYTFLCDTFLGSEPMNEIKKIFIHDGRKQPIIVFNSHSDWDHVWGNYSFKDSLIISHEKCRERLTEDFWEDYVKYKDFHKGQVKLCLPNLTFQSNINFVNEDIVFFHTPGHTIDSSSCYDKRDNILYVGDNVEAPIPYLQSGDLANYIKSLNKYIELDPQFIVTGHGKEASISLIKENLKYIENLYYEKEIDISNFSAEILERHKLNLKQLGKIE